MDRLDPDCAGPRTGLLKIGMRILVVSNFYPPQFIGGYELACRDMVDALRGRGHEVCVLTSTHGVAGPMRDGIVYRWLKTHLEWGVEEFRRYMISVFRRELINQRAFKRLCNAFRPDVVYAWNLWNMVSLGLKAQQMPWPVCYFVFDHWFSKMESDPWLSLLHHRPRRFPPRLFWSVAARLLRSSGVLPPTQIFNPVHVQFASQYLKDAAVRAGKPVEGAEVIYWGLDLNNYPYKVAATGGAKLLYAGEIGPHKGVHTAIEALNILVRQRGWDSATLTIIGGTRYHDYNVRIHQLVTHLGLEGKIHFEAQVAREDLAKLYQAYDVLLFPSVWEEPFGITLLEAMAAGIPIVGTATGGANEILQDGTSAVVFPKGDAGACADAVRRLLEDRCLYDRVRTGGRHTVEKRFRLERTVDQIERSLMRIVRAAE